MKWLAVAATVIGLAVLIYQAKLVVQCAEKGGTVVRGVFAPVCVKLQVLK